MFLVTSLGSLGCFRGLSVLMHESRHPIECSVSNVMLYPLSVTPGILLGDTQSQEELEDRLMTPTACRSHLLAARCQPNRPVGAGIDKILPQEPANGAADGHM